MGFTCQVVRGSSSSTFRAHSCWGGGGSVANALFHVMKALGIIFSL